MKQYIRPEVKINEVRMESTILTMSTYDSYGGTQLTKNRRGTWGNLWCDDSQEEEE